MIAKKTPFPEGLGQPTDIWSGKDAECTSWHDPQIYSGFAPENLTLDIKGVDIILFVINKSKVICVLNKWSFKYLHA